MVASKRGRGARNQAAKAKPAEEPVAAAAPEPVPAEVAAEAAPEAAPAENNGTEPAEQPGAESAPEPAAEAAEGEAQPESESAEAAEAAAEAAKKAEEEKVESGKILVENLPVSYLFDYQEKLKDLFSKYGEITHIKRGPNVVTELTTTPTLSAIIEFKNKDSLDKALSEDGALVDGSAISVCVESRAETAVLVGVPYEAGSEYVRLLFEQAGSVAHIHEFSKTKYKIYNDPELVLDKFYSGGITISPVKLRKQLRVTFHEKESVEKALKLDRELRLNGFLVTVSKYRDDDEQKAHNATISKNKRQHSQNRNSNANANTSPNANANSNRNNAFRARGGAGFNTRGNFRGEHYGARGRGGFQRGGGGAFPRPAFAPVNTYMPPQGFMGRPGGFMDGQRPNKRLRQM